MSGADPDFAIVGLGLIGGSIARDLAALGATVAGYDTDGGTLEQACAEGIVRYRLDASLAGCSRARVIVLAVPVTAAPGVLEHVARLARPDALITDVGSTKQSIESAALRTGVGEQFVGAHPLAGDHRAGWTASRPGLCRGSTVYLCPTPATRERALQEAIAFWRTLGAEPRLTSAAQHDRLLAWTSHLPQAAAFLLAATIARTGIDRAWLGPGGRDTMRLAASPPALWTGIAVDNAARLRAGLAALQACLAELENALEAGDPAGVQRVFEEGRHWYCGP